MRSAPHQFSMITCAAAAAAVAASMVVPGQAHACSCAPSSAEEIYNGSRASFIGVLDRVDKRGVDAGRFHYRVKQSFKRGLGEKVVVRSSLQESACGLPQTPGSKIALGLDGRPGEWQSGLCLRTSARGLRKAAADESKTGPNIGEGVQCGR